MSNKIVDPNGRISRKNTEKIRIVEIRCLNVGDVAPSIVALDFEFSLLYGDCVIFFWDITKLVDHFLRIHLCKNQLDLILNLYISLKLEIADK